VVAAVFGPLFHHLVAEALMSNTPTITIGITTYNAEATVCAALESALQQTLPASQIIVVDDASNDRTLHLVARYQEDPRLLVIQNPVNSGVAVSRNRIIQEATGEFIAFFDDDDVSDSKRLQLQLDRILRYEQAYAAGAAVLCHTARKQYYSDGRVHIEPALGHIEQGPAPSGLAVASHALMGRPLQGGYGACATCSQMARTSTYRELGGFDPALRRCEDFDLAIRLARVGGHFPGIVTPLVRQTMTATSDKTLPILEMSTLKVFAKHRDLFSDLTEYRFSCWWIHLKYCLMSRRVLWSFLFLLVLLIRFPGPTLYRLRRSSPDLHRNCLFSAFAHNACS
jgi:glycosyltransferase involved in cell wall biosynthesis